MTPLIPALLIGLGGTIVSREIETLEHAAETQLAARLAGQQKVVQVNARPAGFGVIWGEVSELDISAHSFEVDQIPFFAEPTYSQAGKIKKLTMNLREFNLAGLEVASLNATIPDCRYDFAAARDHKLFRLTRSGAGTGSVSVTQDALADYLVSRYKEIERATVKIEKDHAWVEGYVNLGFFKSEFAVVSKLAARNGSEIVFDNPKIYFDWIRTDEIGTRAITSFLDPIIDLNDDLGLFGAMDIQTLTLESGLLTASGTVSVPSAVSRTGS